MAELLVRPLLSAVTEKASSYLVDQYKVMEGMEDQRKALDRMLPLILDVIQDAEKRTKQSNVSAWLDELKKVSYEAIDVFDEFKYEALRREAKKKGHDATLGKGIVSLFPSRNPIVFRYRMGKKLRKIVQKIKELVSEMNSFGLIKQQQETPKQWRQTDSIMVDTEKDIVSRSRDEEKKKIIKMLLDEARGKDLTVLPIVGMGGLGKTTFAQLIYNDPEIDKHFPLRRWCCVSDVFDVVAIANSICMSTERDREKALQDLQKEVGGKKYLIVLDDVWNRDSDKWGKLKTCLKNGDIGSVVLTTTRDSEVARIMVTGEVQVHNLENLGEAYLMEIIQSKALRLAKSDEHFEVLRKIVQRCDGSPLAAKSFCSLLFNRTTVQEWKDILAKSNSICNVGEDRIYPILRLSYDDLPLHIKQCFAFCAIFPKDYVIDVETLIKLWLAHDFIPLQEDDNIEMVAEHIFNELVWRSFFQDVKKFPLRTTCKIHDLMHDIAQSVMGKECVSSRSDFKSLLSEHPTYHFVTPYSGTFHLDDFMRKQSPTLRTLLCEEYNMDISILHLSKSSSLRALRLRHSKEILPIRPRYLQHLRYLDISQNCSIKELPEDICILYNLQTLILSDCQNLVGLPKDMKYMTSLRHLYTNGCSKLKCMPPDLGQLTSLRTITDFVVGASSGCSTLRELHSLNLCGGLELRGLENVSQEDAKAANLRNKEKLTHLSLVWDSECCVEEPNCHGKVLDALKPHRGLLMLNVISYKSTHFPAWMTDLSMLQNLVELKLEGCTMCEEFPQFIQFKSLQVLCLIRLDKLQTLCCDEGRQGKEEAFHLLEMVVIMSCPKFRTLVHDMASTTFPALKEIYLRDLEGLDRFVAIGGRQENGPTFPLLEEVVIGECPKLQTLCYQMASTAFPSLKKIMLYDLEGLERLVENESSFPLLEEADIRNCQKLRSLPEAPKLKIFRLKENKPELSLLLLQSRYMSSLSMLILYVDDKEATVQLDQIHESSLLELELTHCNFFFPLSPSQPIIMFWKWLGHLVHLEIIYCDVLIYWPEEEFLCLVSLKALRIMGCDKLIGRPTLVKREPTCRARDQLLPRLTSLSIRTCHSLRELFVLPPSLTEIEIRSCSNLEFIWGKRDTESESVQVEHHDTFASSEHSNDRACRSLPEQSPSAADHPLPCLEDLDVVECPKMVALENLPSSLKNLSIFLCPEIHSVSGQLYALNNLYISHCNKLESLNRLGDMQSLESLYLWSCKRLASLPCGLGSYSSLLRITIEYCPALNMKPLYEHLRTRSDSLEIRDLSHAHARDPSEEPKRPTLRDPKSWKYAIPGCQ